MHIVHRWGWYSSVSGDFERLRFSHSDAFPRLDDGIIRLQDDSAVEELVQYHSAYPELVEPKACLECK